MRSKSVAIVTDPDAISTRCDPVEGVLEGLEIADQLHASLKDSKIPGVGLAANQIGINKRVFVMNIPYEDYLLGYTFVNPSIETLGDQIEFDEGCLSFPGKSVKTLRYAEVIVKDDLAPEGRKFTGLAAVCAQHEYDHLDGITMYDRVSRSRDNNG